MAEEATFKEMSAEDADRLARDIQLGGPDYVLPSGQTKREFFEEQRSAERAALEARRGESEAEARDAAPQSAGRVRVGFRDGQLIVQPVASEPTASAADASVNLTRHKRRSLMSKEPTSTDDKNQTGEDKAPKPPAPPPTEPTPTEPPSSPSELAPAEGDE